ncbi:MAG: hypothetical protein GY816_20970, partial [Cytophagales bacterium]|nr:hypothetical protein [Cytophagales bacterium]
MKYFLTLIFLYQVTSCYSQVDKFPRMEVVYEKPEIVVGECGTIIIRIFLSNEQKLLHFKNEEYLKYIPNLKANFDGFYFEEFNWLNKFKKSSDDSKEFYWYDTYKISFCPSSKGEILFPSMRFRYGVKHGVPLFFNTDSVKIDVTEDRVRNTCPDLVGEFAIKETGTPSGNQQVGTSFELGLEITGNGNLFPLNFHDIENDDLILERISTDVGSEFASGKLLSRKSIQIKVTPKRPAVICMKDLINWSYYSISKKECLKIGSEKTFEFVGSVNYGLEKGLIIKKNVIALDISESMEVEGYGTIRLQKGIDIVNRLIEKNSAWLLGFSGEVAVITEGDLNH